MNNKVKKIVQISFHNNNNSKVSLLRLAHVANLADEVVGDRLHLLRNDFALRLRQRFARLGYVQRTLAHGAYLHLRRLAAFRDVLAHSLLAFRRGGWHGHGDRRTTCFRHGVES